MSDDDGQYHVEIEQSRHGGFVVTLTGPGIPICVVEHVETVEEGRTFAQDHVAWLRSKQPTVEYTL